MICSHIFYALLYLYCTDIIMARYVKTRVWDNLLYHLKSLTTGEDDWSYRDLFNSIPETCDMTQYLSY